MDRRVVLLCLCVFSTLSAGGAQTNDEPLSNQSELVDNKIDQQFTRQPYRNVPKERQQQNHKPVFTDCQTYNPSVEEEQRKGTFVFTVKADDVDDKNKPGGRVTYAIEKPPGTRVNFEINSTTGDVYTYIPFDRDEPTKQKELYLTVTAKDDGRPVLADICTFKVTVTDINDNTPSFDQQMYATDVPEDLRENSEVLRVFAYDFDDGLNSKLSYSFGKPPSDFDNFFKIDSDTGVIRLKKSLLQKRGTKYDSTVVVHDNGIPRLEATAEISFTVVDSDKKPPSITISGDGQNEISLMEGENDFDRVLFNLTANSNIKDKSIAFSLVLGKTIQTNKEAHFALAQDDPFSPALIKLGHFLDYEQVTEFQLTVRAENKDSLYATVNLIIKVQDANDEIPTFIELLKGSVVENGEPGAHAMTVRAIDKDGTSPNNEVVYELISHKDIFQIDPKSGVITAKTVFDREEENVYHVVVEARDSAPSSLLRNKTKPNTARQPFQINIEDQNDNEPKFTKAIYVVYNISEKTDTQKVVLEVQANDKDTASIIEYSIIEGNVDGAFAIEKSTGRIKVENKLDFEKIESYNLTVCANDSIFTDTAKVIIHILNENDEPPIFEPHDKNITFLEETLSTSCLITLEAYDPDIKDRTADQKIVYTVGDGYKNFLSVSNDGCVGLIKKLDRDPPKGAPSYQAFVHAYDNDGRPVSLASHTEINIVLIDINDNAPFLDMREVVWYENEEPGMIVTLQATDNDSPVNGPPFSYELADTASPDIQDKFSIQQDQLFAKVSFDREEQKFYDVPVRITDSGEPPQSDISILRVIIGDKNDNEAKDGSSEIFFYKYKSFYGEIEIGRIYVEDPDDWDLPYKVFQPDGYLDENFLLHDGGMIVLKSQAPEDVYNLNFVVTETMLDSRTHQVKAQVKVIVKEIPEEAVRKSGSIRMKGATIEQFVEKDPMSLVSKKDLLQRHLSKILNTSLENVDVFTVMKSNETFDVRFSAHGSPYYAPEKLNNKARLEQQRLETDLGVEFVMISINECIEKHKCNDSCSNVLQIADVPAVVFTNKTSFVGVKAYVEGICECASRIVLECFNGGTLVEGKCSCAPGYEGPNCEILGASFMGNGWAMYQPFDACNKTAISLHVLPQTDNGLIFYAGPVTRDDAEMSKAFISAELRGGYLVLKIDLGEGDTEEIVSDYKKINNGAMHKVNIKYTNVDVQIEVDECPSDCLKWKTFRKGGSLRLNGPLQVGGIMNLLTEEDAKTMWSNPPTTVGFKGCVTNLTYNSYVYNLGAPSDEFNAHRTCNYGMFEAATFGIDSKFLLALLVCLAIMLILLLAVVVHRRKQDNFNEKELDDPTENIINYEDEGGGECDTHFDLSVLQNVDEKPPMKENLYRQAPDVPADIGSFLDDKKRACDKDTLPCDDVRHYGYEGDGNSTGSLSSLASCTDEGDLKFNYLSSFGPRFRKLADMYGDDASEEGSQNGGEESWC